LAQGVKQEKKGGIVFNLPSRAHPAV